MGGGPRASMLGMRSELFWATHVSFENQLFSLKVPKQVLALDVFGGSALHVLHCPTRLSSVFGKRPVPKTVSTPVCK